MDADTSFFFATGIAFLIALLAFGDQIRQPSRELKDAEEKIKTPFGLTGKELNGLLGNVVNSEKPFLEAMTGIAKLASSKKFNGKIIDAIETAKKLVNEYRQLETLYVARFYLTVLITFFSFIFGIIANFAGHWPLFQFEVNDWLFGALISCLFLLLVFVFFSFESEIKFIKTMNQFEGATGE